ncbi:MAG TPA: MBL fold metallo-hydrolase [Methylomusa anaerophila]|uniref:Putative metallo-hydrolase n=1 Tax=Methylomusa anaerophila TaxID=1930071 RepID=A0A348AP79_9FIRM|nr:MBL fold metallo-hydrolase [Methylomusa anaerophila]BBB92877.1 putative metallo-hydrolase [Methylomusa anaerophila]HML87287.1 MBL fold metallo-hydrolase [Methylomusa anaerophila]
MKIFKMEVGQIGTNCYILCCEDTLEAAVIDPGGDAEEIIAVINREKLNVKYIINTHGHADHIAANSRIKSVTGAAVLIHADDADMLTSAQLNLSLYIGAGITCEPADKLLNDGDNIGIGHSKIKVIHTPGHTPGGICLLVEDTLFAGDTLFAESVGRTDFPGGSHSQLIQNIKNKLLTLPDEIKVLPGHGPATTIGRERKMNPFIQ